MKSRHCRRHVEIQVQQGRDRIVVSTLRCGRNNPGSNPGHGTLLIWTEVALFFAWLPILVPWEPVFRTIYVRDTRADCRQHRRDFERQNLLPEADQELSQEAPLSLRHS